MANNVDRDEMAHVEPSHLDLHCLQRCLFWSAELNGLRRCKGQMQLCKWHCCHKVRLNKTEASICSLFYFRVSSAIIWPWWHAKCGQPNPTQFTQLCNQTVKNPLMIKTNSWPLLLLLFLCTDLNWDIYDYYLCVRYLLVVLDLERWIVAISVQAESSIRRKECRDVLCEHWPATRSL